MVKEISKDKILIVGNSNIDSGYKFYVRRNSSDVDVFKQIYYQPDYPALIEKVSKIFKGPAHVRCIIDGGAYIGFSTFYWARSFPFAQVIALEAEDSNFQLLKKNVRLNGLNNITLLHNAVWSHDEDLAITREKMDKRPWAFAVENLEEGDSDIVQGRSLFTLMKEYKLAQIDVLKLDIEGAEKQVFLMDDKIGHILEKTKVVICELHYFDQQRQKIIDVLISNGFSKEHIGEDLLFVNRKLVS